MYIQVEAPRVEIDSVPNSKTPDKHSHWHFVRQPLLMFKNGENYPDKTKLMLTISASEKEANEVKPFQSGFYAPPTESKPDLSSLNIASTAVNTFKNAD